MKNKDWTRSTGKKNMINDIHKGKISSGATQPTANFQRQDLAYRQEMSEAIFFHKYRKIMDKKEIESKEPLNNSLSNLLGKITLETSD